MIWLETGPQKYTVAQTEYFIAVFTCHNMETCVIGVKSR